MKKVLLVFGFFGLLFSKWIMFQGKSDSFLYNDETGEVFRHFQVFDKSGNFLKEEGMIRVKFTTYTKYPFGSSMVAPTGNTPKQMIDLEEKIIKEISK